MRQCLDIVGELQHAKQLVRQHVLERHLIVHKAVVEEDEAARDATTVCIPVAHAPLRHGLRQFTRFRNRLAFTLCCTATYALSARHYIQVDPVIRPVGVCHRNPPCPSAAPASSPARARPRADRRRFARVCPPPRLRLRTRSRRHGPRVMDARPRTSGIETCALRCEKDRRNGRRADRCRCEDAPRVVWPDEERFERGFRGV